MTKDKDRGGLGLRSLEAMNATFLTKLGWRLMFEEKSLWKELMAAKYAVHSSDPSTWQPKTSMSNAWKGIVKITLILKKGIRKIVRNGRNTLFWMDAWLGDCPLMEYITMNLPLPELYSRVVDH